MLIMHNDVIKLILTFSLILKIQGIIDINSNSNIGPNVLEISSNSNYVTMVFLDALNKTTTSSTR